MNIFRNTIALTIIVFIFCLTKVSLLNGETLNSKVPLGDRVVIEINNIVYTQRQVEVYIAVKESLKTAQSSEIRLVNAVNWFIFLEEFKQDMIIEQEAQRLASFTPTERMISKAEEIYKNKLDSNSDLRGTALKLDVNKNTLIHTIPSALRIEAFRRSKEKKADDTKEKEAVSVLTSGPKPQWLVELEQRAVVRYFDDSTTYRHIKFIGSSDSTPNSDKK